MIMCKYRRTTTCTATVATGRTAVYPEQDTLTESIPLQAGFELFSFSQTS